MTSKPIGTKTHCAIDYGFIALQALAPTFFRLRGPAQTLCYAFAGQQLLVNAFTDQPLALRRVLPFRVHGQLETPVLPALLLLPWATGALKQRNARWYFASFFAAALTNYWLTDYHAQEKPNHRE